MARPFPRISGRVGQPIILGTTFYHAGAPEEPYAVRKIEIYKSSVRDENLVVTIPIPDPGTTNYPSPLERFDDRPGYLQLVWDVPCELSVPDIFFDKWYFIPSETCNGTIDDLNDESVWVEKCNRFWLYPDGWYSDDGLETIRFGFEPLDVKFNKGERRMLEVGLMPLPLYDYNHNLVAPIIPFLEATIFIRTRNHEILVNEEPMTVGIRQGSFRSNPYVLQFLLDTGCFLVGTYVYRITVKLPNGQSIRSKEFDFTVSV